MKLSDLLKPKWQHSDPTVRARAVASGALDGETLATVIREDKDPGVRAKAIELSTDTNALLHATQNAADQHGAIRRLGVLLTTVDAASAMLNALAPELCSGLLAALRDSEVQLTLLPKVLANISVEKLLEVPLPATVQSACVDHVASVEAVDQAKARLGALRDTHAGRNKAVHRRAEERLATIVAEEARQAAFIDACARLVDEFQALAVAPWNDHLRTRLDLIEKRWAAATASGDYSVDKVLMTRLDAARATIDHTLEEMPRRIAAAEQSASEVANTLEERLVALQSSEASWEDLADFCNTVRGRWDTVDQSLLGAAIIEPVVSRLDRLDTAASCYSTVAALEPKLDLGDIRSQLAGVDWPASFPEPLKLQELRRALAEREAEATALAKAEEKALAALVSGLETLEAAVEAGDLAAGWEADKQLSDKTTEKLDRHLHHRLSAAQKKLRDLRDWQGFATVPKRQAMCEAMEALTNESCTDAPGRAEAVKALQNDWKALGRSDSPTEQRLWRRFRKAADSAYAPAKQHFAHQEAARQQNLANAEAMCGQLESFLDDNDWDHADWPAIRKILRTSREGFQKLSDLPRRAVKPIRDRFNKATRAISSRVQEEERSNEATKRALIDELAESLTMFRGANPDAKSDDPAPADSEAAGGAKQDASMSELINLAKDAQRRWREVGITRYKKDKQLWADFRARCDDVFALRDAKRNEAQSAEQVVVNRGEQICAELEQVLNSDEQDRTRLGELKRTFNELDLPRGAGKVRKRFNEIQKRIETARRDAQLAEEQAEFDELKSCAASFAEAEADPDRLEQAAANVERLPEHLRKRMASRLSETRKGINGNLIANAELAETLCVRAEMLASIPSPPEATQLRLKLQVDTLNDKFSRGQVDNRSTPAKFRELQVDWYCLGPLESGLRMSLEARFRSAEQALQA